MMSRKGENFHREKNRSLIKDRESEWHQVFNSHCSSVNKLCPTFCDPMDCSMPGSLFLHYLPEFAQIHVHWVGDAIQPSHPLLPSSQKVKCNGISFFKTPKKILFWKFIHKLSIKCICALNTLLKALTPVIPSILNTLPPNTFMVNCCTFFQSLPASQQGYPEYL